MNQQLEIFMGIVLPKPDSDGGNKRGCIEINTIIPNNLKNPSGEVIAGCKCLEG